MSELDNMANFERFYQAERRFSYLVMREIRAESDNFLLHMYEDDKSIEKH